MGKGLLGKTFVRHYNAELYSQIPLNSFPVHNRKPYVNLFQRLTFTFVDLEASGMDHLTVEKYTVV